VFKVLNRQYTFIFIGGGLDPFLGVGYLISIPLNVSKTKSTQVRYRHLRPLDQTLLRSVRIHDEGFEREM
jgi:hypothetical protein